MLNLPPLSSFLKARVREPLPTKSPLYLEALGGFIRPDLAGELERWRKEPPFALDTSSAVSSTAYWFRTQDLEAVLHGVRMREQEEKILERQTQLESSGYEAGMEVLRAEVVQLLADFERVSKLEYHPYVYSWEYAMWKHYITWQVRTIHHLYYLEFVVSV